MRLAILAARALAELVAWNAELETLAVVFLTPRSLAGAALSVSGLPLGLVD